MKNNKAALYGSLLISAAWLVLAVVLCFYVNDYNRAFLFDKGRILYTVEEINVHFVHCLRAFPQALLYPDRRFFTVFAFLPLKLLERAGLSPMLSMRLMNAFISALALYLFMAILRRQKFPPPVIFLCGLLLIINPLFVFLSISTLPDITFILFLLLSLRFVLENKFVHAAVFISILPFIRFDGIFVLALFFLIFAANGKTKHTAPILFFPLVFYILMDTILYRSPFRSFMFFREQYNIIYTYTARNIIPHGFFEKCLRLTVSVLNPPLVFLALYAVFQRGRNQRLPEGFIFLAGALSLAVIPIYTIERVPHGRVLLPLSIAILFFVAATLERTLSLKLSAAKTTLFSGLFVLSTFLATGIYKNGLPESAFRTPHVENPSHYQKAYRFLHDTIQQTNPEFVFIDFYTIPEIIINDDHCAFHQGENTFIGFILNVPAQIQEIRYFYYDEKIRISTKTFPPGGIIITRRKPSLMQNFSGAALLRVFPDEGVYVYLTKNSQSGMME